MIASIANELYYKGKVANGLKDALGPAIEFPPIAFIDIENDREKYSKKKEGIEEFILRLYQHLVHEIGVEDATVVLLTMCNSLSKRLDKSQEASLLSLISDNEINEYNVLAVDGMKGREADVVLLWCAADREANFAKDVLRLCTALTRAKRHLVLIGRFASLSKNLLWSKVLKKVKAVGEVISSQLINI